MYGQCVLQRQCLRCSVVVLSGPWRRQFGIGREAPTCIARPSQQPRASTTPRLLSMQLLPRRPYGQERNRNLPCHHDQGACCGASGQEQSTANNPLMIGRFITPPPPSKAAVTNHHRHHHHHSPCRAQRHPASHSHHLARHPIAPRRMVLARPPHHRHHHEHHSALVSTTIMAASSPQHDQALGAYFFSSSSIVTDFGRSMGRPSARDHTPCTRHGTAGQEGRGGARVCAHRWPLTGRSTRTGGSGARGQISRPGPCAAARAPRARKPNVWVPSCMRVRVRLHVWRGTGGHSPCPRAHLRQHAERARHPEEHGVVVLLGDAVVLQQHAAVRVHVGPRVLDLRTAHSNDVGVVGGRGVGWQEVTHTPRQVGVALAQPASSPPQPAAQACRQPRTLPVLPSTSGTTSYRLATILNSG